MDNSAVVSYRVRLLEQLGADAQAFCAACRAVKDPFKATGENDWNVYKIARHVRDVDAQSYGMRARRTLAEEYPAFPKFDANLWMAEHDDSDEPLEKVLADFEQSIHELVGLLTPQPDRAWSRLGRHEIQGDRTLQIWVERDLEHIREHLETVRKLES